MRRRGPTSPIAWPRRSPADFTFYKVAEERLGRPAPAWPWLCLLVVRKATKTRGRPGRLGEVAAEYGIALDAHGATGDALTAALLLTPMMRKAWAMGAFASPAGAQPRPRYPDDWRGDDEDGDAEDKRIETVDEFFAWQRGAALYQERDFADYARRSGWAKPPDSLWHALCGVEAPGWNSPTTKAMPCPSDCGASVLLRVGKDGGTTYTGLLTTEPHVCSRPEAV